MLIFCFPDLFYENDTESNKRVGLLTHENMIKLGSRMKSHPDFGYGYTCGPVLHDFDSTLDDDETLFIFYQHAENDPNNVLAHCVRFKEERDSDSVWVMDPNLNIRSDLFQFNIASYSYMKSRGAKYIKLKLDV